MDMLNIMKELSYVYYQKDQASYAKLFNARK
jgi:hypothetical protein